MSNRTLLDYTGHTPFLFLPRMSRLTGNDLHVKYDGTAMGGSTQSRTGAAILKQAMESGRLSPGNCVVEACRPDMALALSQASTMLDLRLIVVMLSNTPRPVLNLIHAMGTEIVLSEADAGMKGARDKAEFIHHDIWNSFWPNIGRSDTALKLHDALTGTELVNDCLNNGVTPDIFLCCVDSGATITGAGSCLRRHFPDIGIVGVRCEAAHPGAESALLPAGFADDIIDVSDDDMMRACRRLLKMEAVCGGPAAGACLHAVMALPADIRAERRNIVMLFPDSGERYLHTNLFV